MVGRNASLALAMLLLGCADNNAPQHAEKRTTEKGHETRQGAEAAEVEAVANIQATIDFSKSSTIAAQVEAFASKLQGGTIYLDLTIIPQQEGENEPDYRVAELPQNGATRPLSCSFGHRLDSREFTFSFNPDYNHLLLQILHGPPHLYPHATAACIYRDSSTVPDFNITGYYVVSTIDIPTANDVQLRPVNPPAR